MWSSSTEAARYVYCYDAVDNNVCDTAWVEGESGAVLSQFAAGTTYYWQVKAINGKGEIYADDEVWSRFVPQRDPARKFFPLVTR
jgi:hypothetical protein